MYINSSLTAAQGNAQASAIRLGLAARLPRRCRSVFHMLPFRAGLGGKSMSVTTFR